MPFSEITGHEHNIKALKRSIENGRVHHAYIFSGPEGVGKKLTAMALAKTLNCLEAHGDFCGHCASCKKIETGNHPDVKIIEPDGQLIKIDQIRELQKDLQFRPFEGKKRVFIIDGADRMGLPASNSILKTLEEPPRDSVLILITSNFHALLPTVVSRCQRLSFSSLPISVIEKMLVEKKGAGVAHIVAAISEGSIGRALGEDEGSIIEERERVFAGLTGMKNAGNILRLAEEMSKDEDLEGVLRILKILYRDMAALKGGSDDLINTDMLSRVSEYAGLMSMEAILDGFDCISETESLMKRNINKQLALEVMMMRISQ